MLEFECTKCGNPITTKHLKFGEFAHCHKCGNKVPVPENALIVEEKDFVEKPVLSGDSIDQMIESEKDVSSMIYEYPTLRIVAKGLEILAFLSAFALLFVPLILWYEYRSVPIVITGIISCLNFMAIYFCLSEGIRLFINIADDTRKSRDILNDIKETLTKNMDKKE